MTTRIRDENIIHAPGRKQLKKGNENNLSITRPTLASSAKAKPGMLPPLSVGYELITELQSKGSRTVLAPLLKSNPNATPRHKDTTEKPKPLTNKISIKSNPLQTPKPVKKVVPKSTKKTINVYTPARPKGVDEVEHSHPKPPGWLPPAYHGTKLISRT
jgi:hypothetical protein